MANLAQLQENLLQDLEKYSAEDVSALIYRGAGNEKFRTAVQAWRQLQERLEEVKKLLEGDISQLLDAMKSGLAKRAMQLRVGQYAEWVGQTAATAEHMGSQAEIVCNAYAEAQAGMVKSGTVEILRQQMQSLKDKMRSTEMADPEDSRHLQELDQVYAEMHEKNLVTMRKYVNNLVTAAPKSGFHKPPLLFTRAGAWENKPKKNAIKPQESDPASKGTEGKSKKDGKCIIS
ncbi:MAG: PPE family protein [Sphingopyxis sp.]|nr:PPE family protein [Sphingopyxis sp.]